jgi:hypothetical protein
VLKCLRSLLAAWLVVLIPLSEALAQIKAAAKPPLPVGKPTTGFAVAVIAEGFDYTRATVAAKFARDGEGEAIAYDAVDDDRKPYGPDGRLADLMALATPFVVPVRVDPAQGPSWQRAFAFVRRSPARVVVILARPPASAWDAFQTELKAMPERLFILAADPAREKTTLGHVLTVAALPAPDAKRADLVLAAAAAAREAPRHGTSLPTTADEAAVLAAGLFTCIDVSAARGPHAVKALLVAKAARAVDGAAPMLEVCR